MACSNIFVLHMLCLGHCIPQCLSLSRTVCLWETTHVIICSFPHNGNHDPCWCWCRSVGLSCRSVFIFDHCAESTSFAIRSVREPSRIEQAHPIARSVSRHASIASHARMKAKDEFMQLHVRARPCIDCCKTEWFRSELVPVRLGPSQR